MKEEYDLNLKEGVGWVLITNAPPIFCKVCLKKLSTPFQFCETEVNGRCYDCEVKTTKRTCMNLKEEHIHYDIIEIKTTFIEKMKAFVLGLML